MANINKISHFRKRINEEIESFDLCINNMFFKKNSTLYWEKLKIEKQQGSMKYPQKYERPNNSTT